MEKTKLGVSVGLLGAFIYAAVYFGGYVAGALAVGYVLLFESNEWLKKAAVKALAIAVVFSMVTLVLSLIPDALSVINDVLGLFKGYLSIPFIGSILTAMKALVALVKEVLFAILVYKALNQGTVTVPVVDDLINKHM